MYLLFSGDKYYPSGGWQDFDGTYATLEYAIMYALDKNAGWWHIVDILLT